MRRISFYSAAAFLSLLAWTALTSGCDGGGSIAVTVSPTTANVYTGATRQFSAVVAGTTNRSVTWSVNDVVGGNATLGTISASGRYTAPAVIPNPDTVMVKARSVADTSKYASATVTITEYTGQLLWLKGFGGTGSDASLAIAVDASGDVLVTGDFEGTVDFGGGELISAGSGDIFVAKYSGVDGTHLWSKRFGNTDSDWGWAIAVDGNGDAMVIGSFGGTVDFGGGVLTSAGSSDLFVMKLSGVDGTHLWSKRFGGTDNEEGGKIAADGDGDVLVTGNFEGTVDFGGGPLNSAGDVDVFAVKLSGVDGAHLWSKRFGSTNSDNGRGIVVDGSGDVLVTGWFESTVDFGGGPLNSAGGLDIFVMKLSGVDGAHLWSKQFGNTQWDGGMRIAVDGNGDAMVTGWFDSTVDFGGGPLNSAGNWDVFLVKLSGVDGTHLWLKRFGSTNLDGGMRIAVDGSGNVLVMGFFENGVNFGGGPLTSAGGEDIFVAKYSGVDGAYFWAKRFGSTDYDWGAGIAVDSSANVLATGSFRETSDFEGEFLTSGGDTDIFVVKLAP